MQKNLLILIKKKDDIIRINNSNTKISALKAIIIVETPNRVTTLEEAGFALDDENPDLEDLIELL